MKQAFARFHQVKNASEISLYFKGNTIASLHSARCTIFLNSSFASLTFIKKNMRNMQIFQGCVYCLILNYHGSLLRCFKQLCYYIKFISACQEVFYSFQNFLNSCSLRATQISYHICSFLSITFLKPFYKKRRKRDLNPRAGCPTYTLSRGASSAS